MADFYTLITNAGIAYENACKAAGVPIKLSQISVGDGNGAVYNPAATATALKREVWRGPLNSLFQDEKNPSWLLAEVTIPAEIGGFYVREAGIWTDSGVLYAIVKYPESFKPVLATSGSGKEFYIRAIFETSNASQVTLLIDDSVVKATRAWVISYLADELAKLDGKQSVRVAATGNIVLSGAQQVDDVAVVAGDRVLVPKQASGKDNGIYVVSNGAWVRSGDADNSLEVTPGLFVVVEAGTVNGDSVWQLVTDAPIVLGTTALSFEMIAGRTGVAAGSYRSLTVDKNGRVIAGTNPTTLSGYGIDIPTQAEAEAQADQDNAKPMTVLRVFQAIAKKLGLMAQTGLTDATVGKLMLVGAGGMLGPVEPFGDPNAMPWRTGHFGATAASVANGPPGATLGDMVFQEIYNANAAAQHWTCYASAHKYTRRWNVGVWSAWDEDLTVASVGALMTATQPQTNSGVDDTKYVTPKKFAAGVAALVIQATEAIGGIAKIASQSAVNSGVGNDTIVTPQKLRFGLLVSLNANGYVVFPQWLGGFIIQWVTSPSVAPGAAGSVAWPMAFPTAALHAVATPLGIGSNSQAGNVVRGAVSNTGVNLYNWGPIGASACIWAIGA